MEKVTIVLPTYNRKSTITESIESVVNQTFTNWRMIVVDDASSDGTEEIVRDINDERIVYIRNEQNSGPSYSRNVGVKLANSEYIAFQDSDTIWHPEKLQLQLDKIETGAFAMVYHPYKLNENIYPADDIPLREKQGSIYRYLLYCAMIGTPCMFVRKEIFDKVGGFADELKCLEDYELSLRIAKNYPIGFISQTLLTAKDSQKSVGKDAVNEMKALFYIMRCYYKDLEENPYAKKLLFNRISFLSVNNKLMENFYILLDEYLKETDQELGDIEKLYDAHD